MVLLFYFLRIKLRNQDVTDEDGNGADEGYKAYAICNGLEILANDGKRIFATARCDRYDDDQGDDNAYETFANDEA